MPDGTADGGNRHPHNAPTSPHRVSLTFPALEIDAEPAFGSTHDWHVKIALDSTHISDVVSQLRGAADYLEASQPLSRKEAYALYLKTDHWAEKREAAIARAGRKCQFCSSGGYLQVHHNSYENLWNEPPEDLVVLCKACHKRHHGIPDTDTPRIYPPRFTTPRFKTPSL